MRVVIDGGAPTVLDAVTLAQLERTADPRGRLLGWDLVDVLRLATGGRSVGSVSVVSADPSVPPAPLGPLDGGPTYCLVKHSAGGQLRIQVWPVGADAGRPQAVHRDVAHILVETRPDP